MTRTRAFGGTNSASKVVTTLAVMLPRLEGRVILITGAGSGIGRATALLTATEGAMVAAVDVDADGLNSTVDAVRVLGGQITTSVTDVSDRKALTAAIDATAGEVGPFMVCSRTLRFFRRRSRSMRSTGKSGIKF